MRLVRQCLYRYLLLIIVLVSDVEEMTVMNPHACMLTSTDIFIECSRFHPALVSDPGPLLHTDNLEICRSQKHRADTIGCCSLPSHEYGSPHVCS